MQNLNESRKVKLSFLPRLKSLCTVSGCHQIRKLTNNEDTAKQHIVTSAILHMSSASVDQFSQLLFKNLPFYAII